MSGQPKALRLTPARRGGATEPGRFTAPATGSREVFGHTQAGAATIEFAFALMFLLFLSVAFVNISEIFLAHSRLRYATFVASRVEAVGGPARKAASEIDKELTLKITSNKVSAEKKIELPKAVGTLFGTGETFTISHAVKTFKEPKPSGDNAAK